MEFVVIIFVGCLVVALISYMRLKTGSPSSGPYPPGQHEPTGGGDDDDDDNGYGQTREEFAESEIWKEKLREEEPQGKSLLDKTSDGFFESIGLGSPDDDDDYD